MMPQSFLADLFSALGTLVLERLPGNSFQLIGGMPSWFSRLSPNTSATGGQLTLDTEFPFLENFIIDAEELWQAQRPGILRSGLWSEYDASGVELHLEASAAWVGGRKILLVECAGPAYREKHQLLQEGRETKLSLEQRQKALGALQEAMASLERRMAERADELAHANERLNRELTERRHAETALHQSEEQLRQAEKMHALGQLAAGIAHDFNNLLTVIMGSCHHLMALSGQGSPLSKHLEYIGKATERAALLTHQLLVFSSRQLLVPQVLSLNAVVNNISTLLRRLIGENIGLDLVLDPALGRIQADAGQLEQVIMNLVVNARDAMPGGGTLTIRTANLELDPTGSRQLAGGPPGPCVTLAVRDTGCGMDAETRARIFDPFFTTKEPGKGTGLGLSTVYGIVKQSGGEISVTSEPGRGSEFVIYLPRVDPTREESRPRPAPPLAERGAETILLVEDDEGVRGFARVALELNGYRVLEATDGHAALELFRQYTEPVHLLLTDVVMPQMGGRELAERLRSVRPDIRVLYISGYPDDPVARQGSPDAGAGFLQKPFTPSAIARKVRELLDASTQTRSDLPAGGGKLTA